MNIIDDKIVFEDSDLGGLSAVARGALQDQVDAGARYAASYTTVAQFLAYVCNDRLAFVVAGARRERVLALAAQIEAAGATAADVAAAVGARQAAASLAAPAPAEPSAGGAP